MDIVSQKTFNYKRDTKANRAGDEYTPMGYDACQTPASALTPLLPYLDRFSVIWEPASGEGYIEVLFLSKRVNFKMPNKGWDSSAQFPVCWFTNGLGVGSQMTFTGLEESQLSLFSLPLEAAL